MYHRENKSTEDGELSRGAPHEARAPKSHREVSPPCREGCQGELRTGRGGGISPLGFDL